jgi:hypothetical protein
MEHKSYEADPLSERLALTFGTPVVPARRRRKLPANVVRLEPRKRRSRVPARSQDSPGVVLDLEQFRLRRLRRLTTGPPVEQNGAGPEPPARPAG